ncbi:MAG: hypothetical protein EXR72_05915 [Myxococcales bacterium]|nr:hypothetical protein [Myxococcales bacterium]
MTRALRSGPVHVAGYPSLGAAWRLLVGVAPLALGGANAVADTSIPRPGPCALPGSGGPVVVTASEGEGKVPGKPKPRPLPPRPPQLRGKIMMVRPVLEPPTERTGATEAAPPATSHREHGKFLLLHPHGPDEPCLAGALCAGMA